MADFCLKPSDVLREIYRGEAGESRSVACLLLRDDVDRRCRLCAAGGVVVDEEKVEMAVGPRQNSRLGMMVACFA